MIYRLAIVILALCPINIAASSLENLHAHLKHLGLKYSAHYWQISEHNTHITIYESTTGNGFFIAANDSYATLMDSPILAYSNEANFQGTESAWKKNLIESYSQQLEVLAKKESGPSKSPLKGEFNPSPTRGEGGVKPLIKTRWGQDYPYNAHCPIVIPPATRHLTGCVATAMSQLMRYHRHPAQGTGTYHGGKNYHVDFESIKPKWAEMKMDYLPHGNNANDIADVAELMAANARAVSSRFDVGATAANLLAARTILVNRWQYSPKSILIQTTDTRMALKAIRDNLNRQLPVLASGGGHAFLIDGYAGGYCHLNLGWRGAANGYYRLHLAEEQQGIAPIVSEMVIDLYPDTSYTLAAKEVNVREPGTLKHLLTDKEKQSVRRLRITGLLNADDIMVLRRMLGADDGWHEELTDERNPWSGQLQHLDIEDAEFVKDRSKPFLRLAANKGRFVWRNRVYDLSTMDRNEYNRFLSTDIAQGNGYRYSDYNGKPCIEFYIATDKIAPMMFYNCQNLLTVTLPRNTRAILGCAFQHCSSIEKITLPAAVREIEAGAFRQCYLLREVECIRQPIETCHNLFPFKSEGRYGKVKGHCHQGILEGNSIYTCRGITVGGKPVKQLRYRKRY